MSLRDSVIYVEIPNAEQILKNFSSYDRQYWRPQESQCGNIHDMGLVIHKTNNRYVKVFVKFLDKKAKTNVINTGILMWYGRERQNVADTKKALKERGDFKIAFRYCGNLDKLKILGINRMQNGIRPFITDKYHKLF